MNNAPFRLTRFLSRHPATLTLLQWLNLHTPGGGVAP
jgi:hypothetical protein